MPRKGMGSKVTQSGAPAAPPAAFRNQTYGDGERALESQRRVPVPSGPPPVPGGTPARTSGGAGSGPGSGGPDPAMLAQLRMMGGLQAAAKMRPPTSLYAPTERPNEPITAGLPVGPGPGPEVVRTGDRVARTFRLIADVTGDPRMEELAELAARRGA